MDHLGPNICYFAKSSDTRARCTRTRQTFIYCVYAHSRSAEESTYLHQILQLLSWTSRVLTSVLLALSCFRPHQDYLHLSHNPPSSRGRIYFSASLALELSVSPCPFNMFVRLIHDSAYSDFFLFLHC